MDLATVIDLAQRRAADVAARHDAVADSAAVDREAARREADEVRRAAQLEAALEVIPVRLRWARFGEPAWRGTVDLQAVAKLEAMGGKEGRVANPLLTLHGPPGSGKSSAAAAILRARLEAAPRPAGMYVTASDLVSATKATPLGQEVVLVERAKRVSALVLDDMGQEPSGEWNRVVVDVLHERHAQQRWTVVTTYYDVSRGSKDMSTIEDRYGGGLARRLGECRHVGFRMRGTP